MESHEDREEEEEEEEGEGEIGGGKVRKKTINIFSILYIFWPSNFQSVHLARRGTKFGFSFLKKKEKKNIFQTFFDSKSYKTFFVRKIWMNSSSDNTQWPSKYFIFFFHYGSIFLLFREQKKIFKKKKS